MPKTKTSKKRGKSLGSTSLKKSKSFSLNDLKPQKLKKKSDVIADDSTRRLSDIDHIKSALMECLFTNDVPSFKEILKAHFDAVSMSKLSKKAKVPRTTLYRVVDPDSNPTLETLAKILSKLAA